MKSIWTCRRTFLGVLGIVALFALGFLKGMDVAMAITVVAIGNAAANAYQKRGYELAPQKPVGPPVEGEQ